MKRLAVLALVALSSPALADEVFLRGGGSIHGLVVEQTSSKITIEVGPGRVGLPMSRVDHVQGGPSALAEFRARRAALLQTDVQGLLKLGLWARDQGLHTQARALFEEVVALDPQNPGAQLALGNVRLGDRFVSPEESYRAQGLVQYEGSWMTPDERQARMEERSEAARLQADARARQDAAEREAEAQAAAQQAASQMQGGMPFYPGYGGFSPYFGNFYRSQVRRVSPPVVFTRPVVTRPIVVARAPTASSASSHGSRAGTRAQQ
jgi:hypothetical protein